MNQLQIRAKVENLDARVSAIEQILPTLVTVDALKTAIEPLATNETVDGLRQYFDVGMARLREELRGHFDAVMEHLDSKIGLIAEGHTPAQAPTSSGAQR